ncbi:MAG: LOG family protein [Phycisphaerae bacterium]|nr:LOG family protein [Phycisphaerae bacterium]
MKNGNIITVFGSSKPQPGEAAYKTAYELGRALASAGYTVCNGGYGGTMEAGARGAKDAGGRTIGVTCGIFGRSGPNAFLDKIIETDSLYPRLTKLIELGDGYIVLPGGSGTLVELSLVWEMVAKKLMCPKPIVLMGDFWKPVIDISAIERPKTVELIQYAHSVEDAVKRLS